MKISNKGFGAYDIRGIYPEEVNEELAYRIGRVFVDLFHAKKVAIGHDNTDDILESMRDTAMVEKMSEAGGIGLAKTLYEQLQREAHAIKVDA